MIPVNAIRNVYSARKIDTGHFHDLQAQFLDPRAQRYQAAGACVIESDCLTHFLALGGNHRTWIGRVSLSPVYSAVITLVDLANVVKVLKIKADPGKLITNEVIARIVQAIRQLESTSTGKSMKDMALEFNQNVFEGICGGTKSKYHNSKGELTLKMKVYYAEIFGKAIKGTKYNGQEYLRPDASSPDLTDRIEVDTALADAWNRTVPYREARQVFKGFIWLYNNPDILSYLDEFKIPIERAYNTFSHIGHLEKSRLEKFTAKVKAIKPPDRPTCFIFKEIRKSENKKRNSEAPEGPYAELLSLVKKDQRERANELIADYLDPFEKEIEDLKNRLARLSAVPSGGTDDKQTQEEDTPAKNISLNDNDNITSAAGAVDQSTDS